MSVTTISGQVVHYEAYGRGRPLIFVHGWLGSWRYWWPTMQALANQYRSFAVDLWGFGDSSKNVGDYTIESHVAMLEGFIDKMGITTPFSLVGHSLGAVVSLRYTRKSPDSVARIAAVTMPLSREHVNGYLLGRAAETVIDQSKSRFSDYPEVVMGLEKADTGAFGQSIGQVAYLSLAEDLQQVGCPVLLVFGARDTLIKHPSGELDNSNSGYSGRHCVLLEESGHFPMLEQAAVFNRLLKEFIDSPAPGNLEPKNYWQRRTR